MNKDPATKRLITQSITITPSLTNEGACVCEAREHEFYVGSESLVVKLDHQFTSRFTDTPTASGHNPSVVVRAHGCEPLEGPLDLCLCGSNPNSNPNLNRNSHSHRHQ